jgi:hypothetical protein
MGRQMINALLVEVAGAAVGIVKPGDQTQECRFPAALGPNSVAKAPRGMSRDT